MPKPYYEPGLYLCEVIDQGFDESAKGTPFFWLSINVKEKVEEEGNLPMEAQERTIRLYLSEAAVDISAGQLRTIGWTGKWRDLENGACDYTGKDLEFACRHELYNDLPHERWEFPRAAQRPEKRKGVAGKLDARFPQKTTQKAAEKAKVDTREPEVPADEDIPF